MHLKSLTLKGFKSFASATTLHFEPGINAVVGPNGSGKSNVVDALAWVMGEQGAKSLRGGKMEDVIFAGTAGRAPLGRAEVALTIDNTDGSLPIDYTEVTIARTMFRDGGSEYSINGNPCRLLDVQELLSDSGIGRGMHVIVGQGQLDTVLRATPEERRGLIEEAAGVLKHRRRKEKALRKLDAMQANLVRLQDLTTELRRQLKPLGRQAEVARRAVVIQSDARDARLRLLADDLITMSTVLQAEIADESALRERRAEVEAALAAAAEQETALELDSKEQAPHLAAVNEAAFRLSSLRERILGLVSLAGERVRNLQPEPEEERSANDPERLEAEAASMRSEEFEMSRSVEEGKTALADATAARVAAEEARTAEDRRVAAAERAAADRREGLARLTGQVNAAKSRLDARTAEIERLSGQVEGARTRADEAQRAFYKLETDIAGLDEGEVGLDEEYEEAQELLNAADGKVSQLRTDEQAAERERVGLAARLEALEIGLSRKDGGAALVKAADRVPGVMGSVASLIHVKHGFEAAVAAALGPVADAVAVRGVADAVASVELLKTDDAGRVALLVAGAPEPDGPAGSLPAGATWALDVVTCPDDLRGALARLLKGIAIVEDLASVRSAAAHDSSLTYVTREGDLFGPGIARGGSSSLPSLLEVQAAVDEARESLAAVVHRTERIRFELSGALDVQRSAAERVEAALVRLHDSDARMAAVAEQLGALGQTARAAGAEADRLENSARAAADARAADERTLAELQERLETASVEPLDAAIEDNRAQCAQAADAARQAEMDARLALRTGEERLRAHQTRVEQLQRAADRERAARKASAERRERRARQAVVAGAVHAAAQQVSRRLEASLREVTSMRDLAERTRAERDLKLAELRGTLRELGGELERLTDSVHRDEVARAEQRMRITAIENRALEEFGIEPEVLIGEYGPDQLVPPSLRAPGDEIPADAPEPEPYPFVRAEQEKRLANAEKGLALLGRVNPLALEEFSAMEERHTFLTEQLDDLKRSRADLLDIVKEVDDRVQQVFGEAFADVQREFEGLFSRLFPGGEGRIILTDPNDLLTTGVEVEARPPGKRVKRLSLLSGGERSLTAVAFLVALFKARPSPFYVMDEVEAALDDVNLGRLIAVMEELRATSQLLVVTHQKRTMESADALYGVSMRGDGVTQVISQRIRGYNQTPESSEE